MKDFFSKGNNNGNKRRKGSFVLGLEEIRKYFHIPISEAAKEMNVGLTVLKRRCRQLNIMRWPHRKHKSLNSLIQNVKVCVSFISCHPRWMLLDKNLVLSFWKTYKYSLIYIRLFWLTIYSLLIIFKIKNSFRITFPFH